MSRLYRFPSPEEFSALLEELACELPEVFFEGLNAGILISDEAPLHPESRTEQPLYTLGQYCCDQLGRYIVLYYGSFYRLFRGMPRTAIERQMRKTLRHEFRHHLESLSGLRDLEEQDELELHRYRQGEPCRPVAKCKRVRRPR